MTERIPQRRIYVTYDTARDTRIVINDPERISTTQIQVAVSCRMSVDPERNRGAVTVTNLSERTREDLSGVIESTLDLRGPVPSGPLSRALERFGHPRFTADSLADLYTPEQLARAKFNTDPIQKVTTIIMGGGYCEIDVGLDNEVGRMFEGSVSRIRSTKSGPDWKTRFEIADGLTNATGAVVNQTFREGVNVFDVFLHIVRSLGLSSGSLTMDQFNDAIGENVKARLLERGTTISGNSNQQLKRILQHSGAEWFIDRGTVYLVRKGRPIDPGQAPVVVEEGLVGGLRSTPVPIDDQGITIICDFRKDIRIGRLVRTVSRQLSGVWRCDVVDHQITNRQGNWVTRAILRKVPLIPGLEFLGG